MPVTIAHTDIADLCAGSVFLATGGGGDPYVSQIGAVDLVPLGDVPDDAYVVAIGEVGAPTVSLEQLPIGTECLDVIDRFEAWVGRKVTHIVSFEVGGANSVIPLITAAAKKIPLIDGDGMGRALPEAQMMTFAIEGVCPSPAVSLSRLHGWQCLLRHQRCVALRAPGPKYRNGDGRHDLHGRASDDWCRGEAGDRAGYH